MSNNWFTILMSPNSRQPEAAYNLLSSGTVPPLDINGKWDGKPLIGWLARTYQDHFYWTNLGETSDRPHYTPNWIYPGEPLPLSPDQPKSNTVAFPQPMEKRGYHAISTTPELGIYDALFARLLELGADPWVSWEGPSGPIDGFDLAMASGCVPLVQACLLHKNRPDLEQLYKRSPWALMGEFGPRNRTHTKAFFGEHDTLVHAAASSGKDQLLRILLDYGWPVDTRSKFTPIATVQTTEGLDMLLEAGAKLDDGVLKHWQAWAKKFPSHEKTLASRIESVRNKNLGASGEAILSQKALEAFEKKDTLLLDNLLLTARRSTSEGKKILEDQDLPYEKKEEQKALGWAALPDVAAPRNISKQLKTVRPIMAIIGNLFANPTKPKMRLGVRYVCQYAAVDPDNEIADNVKTIGMAQLYYAMCYKLVDRTRKQFLQPSIWVRYIEKMDKRILIEETKKAFDFMSKSNSKKVVDNANVAMRATLENYAKPETMDFLENSVDLVLKLGIEQKVCQVIGQWLQDKPIETRLSWTRVLVEMWKDQNLYTNDYFSREAKSEFLKSIKAIEAQPIDANNEIQVQAMAKLVKHLDDQYGDLDSIREISSRLKISGLSAAANKQEERVIKPKM